MIREFRGRATRGLSSIVLVTVALAWGTPAAVAQEGQAGWLPPSPAEMPTEFDWLKLPSGEWLGGEIKVLYEDTLEFDSDEMGLAKIDWDDVVELRTVRILEVRPVEGESVIGKILIKDGKVTVVGDTTTVFDKSEVLAMTAGQPRERNFWSAEVSGSASYQSGNTDKETFSGRVTVKRRTVEQRLIFDYIGNYDETDKEETENNHRLSGQWDRFVTPKVFWSPVTGEYFKDKFQNIEHRLTLGPAIGYELIDTKTTEWQVSVGPAYTKTWFEDVPSGDSDSEDSFAAQLKTRLDYEVTDDIDIWCDFRGLLTSDTAGGYQHRMETGIAYEVIGDLDLRATWVWDHISDPAEDDNGDEPDKDDNQLLFGVGYSF